MTQSSLTSLLRVESCFDFNESKYCLEYKPVKPERGKYCIISSLSVFICSQRRTKNGAVCCIW